jgi:hypothetical protein
LDLTGWQEALHQFATDLPDQFGGTTQLADAPVGLVGYRILAARACELALNDGEHANRQLFGLYSAVLRVINERTLSESETFCLDVVTMTQFTASVKKIAEKRRASSTLAIGVRALLLMCKCARKAADDAARRGAASCRLSRRPRWASMPNSSVARQSVLRRLESPTFGGPFPA